MSTPDANVVLRDPRRLAVLRETQLLDTPPEECFDRLTRLGASILQVPVVFISLVDETRDYCKSGVGLPSWLAEKREIAGQTFARLTVANGGPLVIASTRESERCRSVPDLASLGAASYSGVPISIDGAAIGSFCAIDIKARDWRESDVAVLEELARTAAREIEMQRALRKLHAPATGKPATGNRLLIAEDDASVRRLMSRILAKDGYEIVEAVDGRETLQILRRAPITALILDLIMPVISGWDVLEERAGDASLREIPVIVVSAKRGPDVARALAFGVFGLLPKPFDPEDLRDLVKTCVAESRLSLPP